MTRFFFIDGHFLRFRSPPALSVAERINELEKQQQQQQTANKFTYFDPEKKHKVPDHSLRAIQKRALLSFYERHQPGSSWRSEPQLSPPPRPPPIPSRPRLPTPLSRRSSVSSEYDTPATWNEVSYNTLHECALIARAPAKNNQLLITF